MIDVDDINEVPEKYRGDYVQVKEGDKDIWRNKGFVALKETSEKYKTRVTELGEKASAYDKLQADLEVKRVKDEADRIAGLHDKKDYKGLLDELTQRYSDLEKRSGETQKQFDERVNALQNDISSTKVEALMNKISDLFTDAGKKIGRRNLASQIKFDTDSKQYKFLDEDGGVTSLDEKGFIAYVESSVLYEPVLKAKVSLGGHGRNATKGTGGADQNDSITPVERMNRARSKKS